jgi:uncharacterized membrane protein YedE/YeeE
MTAALLLGFAFGFLVQRAGLSRYDRIVNVFRLRDLAVLKFLLSALVTAAVGIRLVESLGLPAGVSVPIPPTFLVADLVGGLVFGVGMALAGFCPGTVAAGAGEGRLDYLVPGGLGLYVGALVYGFAYERIVPVLARWGRLGELTIASWLRVEPWLLVVLFVELTLLGFHLLERGARRPGAPTPVLQR